METVLQLIRKLAAFIVYVVYSCIPLKAQGAFMVSTPASIQCNQLFSATVKQSFRTTILNKVDLKTSTPTDFKSWSQEHIPKKISASQLLPIKYLEKLEQSLGQVTVEINDFTKKGLHPKFLDYLTEAHEKRQQFAKKNFGDAEGIEITFSAKENKNFMMISVLFDPTNPGLVRLANLELVNPVPSANLPKLHQSQAAKGMPYPAFKYLQKKIFAFLKQGQFNTVHVDRAQNYTVSLLYRKLLNFNPSTKESERTYLNLDKIYNFSKNLPISLRTNSIDEFSKIIGDQFSPNAKFLSDEKLWEDSLIKNEFPKNMKLLYDKKNELTAITIQNESDGKTALYFIDTASYSYQFIHWSRLLIDQPMDLELSLLP
ncbi:MAG: hypothetical protein WA160_02890 [Pseudobdellovibrio sp.]